MSFTRSVKVINKNGLHARPASVVVECASQFSSEILMAKDSLEVNAKSIMGVLMLAAAKGTTIKLTAVGPDAEDALNAIQKLFMDKFNEKE